MHNNIHNNVQIKILANWDFTNHLTLGRGLAIIFAVKTASLPSNNLEFLGFWFICGGAGGPSERSIVVEIW